MMDDAKESLSPVKGDKKVIVNLKKFKRGKNKYVLLDTYDINQKGIDALDMHESTIPLLDSVPMYPWMETMMHTVIPREVLLTQEEMKNLTNTQMKNYRKTVAYWKLVWWMQSFRHFQQHVRNSEIPGKRPNNHFWRAPPLSIPVRADVLKFNWNKLIDSQKKHAKGKVWNCVVTDPPWTLATEKSTRGVALNYDQITDARLLRAIPWEKLLEKDSAIFMWVINAKVVYATNYLKSLGFKIVESITWIKMSGNRLLARGHGYYLQHAKECCLVAVRGNTDHWKWENMTTSFAAEKRCQSQKPAEFYDMVEAVIPEGYYLEVFGRRNNLRNGWTSIGNQL